MSRATCNRRTQTNLNFPTLSRPVQINGRDPKEMSYSQLSISYQRITNELSIELTSH